MAAGDITAPEGPPEPEGLITLAFSSSTKCVTRITAGMAMAFHVATPSRHAVPTLTSTQYDLFKDVFISCCMYVCLDVCLHIMYVPGTSGTKKNVSDPLGQELQTVVSHQVYSGN